MTNKLDEIQKILNKKVNIDINSKILYLKEKYKEELKDFTYIDDKDFFFKNKNFFVRYVAFNDKLNYGGFFFKADKEPLKIYLINTKKKVWSIDFNKNYIFINKILTNNEKMRIKFEEYLKTIN